MSIQNSLTEYPKFTKHLVSELERKYSIHREDDLLSFSPELEFIICQILTIVDKYCTSKNEEYYPMVDLDLVFLIYYVVLIPNYIPLILQKFKLIAKNRDGYYFVRDVGLKFLENRKFAIDLIPEDLKTRIELKKFRRGHWK
jgi:hypothetical protein